MDKDTKQAAIERILGSRKYTEMDISRDTVTDLINREEVKGIKSRQIIKNVKTKLHNIVAPYLEKLDYSQAMVAAMDCIQSNEKSCIPSLCLQFLNMHVSTRERIEYHQDFFQYIFSKIEPHPRIYDLACGLNPLFLPLVPTPEKLEYIANDIHGPRIELLNLMLGSTRKGFRAHKQDILVNPPKEKASAIFLFKEAHRIEKRESGGSRRLLAELNTNLIFVSLPTHSLRGNFDLSERMSRLIYSIIEGIAELEETVTFASERIYTIRKNDG